MEIASFHRDSQQGANPAAIAEAPHLARQAQLSTLKLTLADEAFLKDCGVESDTPLTHPVAMIVLRGQLLLLCQRLERGLQVSPDSIRRLEEMCSLEFAA
jgi:hypothetical protein